MILILAEKPKAAYKIAKFLSNGNFKKRKLLNLTYYEFFREGKKYVCTSALGHLFKLDTQDKYWYYPVFNAKWLPSFKEFGKKRLKNYLKALSILGRKAEDIIIATDYDIEGDVIGYNILRFVFGRKNAKRMKFSALTKADIENSFRNLMPSLDFGQVFAGLARHYLDFYCGINLTRALSICARKFKPSLTISSGRVQSPTLYLIFKREKEREEFKPKPFWRIKVTLKADGTEFSCSYKKGEIWNEKEAKEIYEKVKNAEFALVKNFEKKVVRKPRPPPFDLTTLQRECFKFFKLTPSQTLKIAENLYLNGLISYPRTSSQKIPPNLNLRNIIKNLGKLSNYSSFCKEILKGRIKIREGRKSDPAHPAIHPTGLLPRKLSKKELMVYDLIVRRFLASAFRDCIKLEKICEIEIEGEIFTAKGSEIKEKGWLLIYPTKLKLTHLPDLKEKQRIKIKEVKLEEDRTKPPERYNLSRILEEMERRKLGTKGTRSRILDILYKRGFIEGKKNIRISELGKKLVVTLEKFSPQVLDEKLSRRFEELMDKIRGRSLRLEDVLEEAKKEVRKILSKIKEKEREIGFYLVKPNSLKK